MTTDSTTTVDDGTLFLGEAWSDPIEAAIRDRIRVFIEELIEEELAAALGRGRYQRRQRRGDGEAGSMDGPPAAETADVSPRDGYRHGHRRRRLCGSFGTVAIAVPRARVGTAGGGTVEWKSRALPRYARMTRQVEALIAGTNTLFDKGISLVAGLARNRSIPCFLVIADPGMVGNPGMNNKTASSTGTGLVGQFDNVVCAQ